MQKGGPVPLHLSHSGSPPLAEKNAVLSLEGGNKENPAALLPRRDKAAVSHPVLNWRGSSHQEGTVVKGCTKVKKN